MSHLRRASSKGRPSAEEPSFGDGSTTSNVEDAAAPPLKGSSRGGERPSPTKDAARRKKGWGFSKMKTLGQFQSPQAYGGATPGKQKVTETHNEDGTVTRTTKTYHPNGRVTAEVTMVAPGPPGAAPGGGKGRAGVRPLTVPPETGKPPPSRVSRGSHKSRGGKLRLKPARPGLEPVEEGMEDMSVGTATTAAMTETSLSTAASKSTASTKSGKRSVGGWPPYPGESSPSEGLEESSVGTVSTTPTFMSDQSRSLAASKSVGHGAGRRADAESRLRNIGGISEGHDDYSMLGAYLKQRDQEQLEVEKIDHNAIGGKEEGSDKHLQSMEVLEQIAPHLKAPGEVLGGLMDLGADEEAILHATEMLVQENAMPASGDSTSYFLTALLILSRKGDENKRTIILADDTFAAITQAMQNHIGGSVEVQRRACKLIGSLSIHPGNSKDVAQMGGCQAVLNAMSAHAEDGILQEDALGCVKALSLDAVAKSTLRSLGALEVVTKIMQKHAQNPTIQSEGCLTLGNLASEDANCSVARVTEENVDAVINSILAHPDLTQVHKAACIALSRLSSSEANVELMRSNFMLRKSLEIAYEQSPSEVGSKVQILFQRLKMEGFVTPKEDERGRENRTTLTRYLFLGRHGVGKESIMDSLAKDLRHNSENCDIYLDAPGLEMCEGRDGAAQEICEKLRVDDFGTNCLPKLVFVVTLGEDGHVNPADGVLMDLILGALPNGEEAISYGIIINNVTKEMRDNFNKDLSSWDAVKACLNEGRRQPTAYIHLRDHVELVDEKENHSPANLFSLRRFLDILPLNRAKPYEVRDIDSASYEPLMRRTERAYWELRNDATKRREKLQTDTTKLRKQMAEMSKRQDEQFRESRKRKINAASAAQHYPCCERPRVAPPLPSPPVLPGAGKTKIPTEPSSVPWKLPMAKARLLPPHYPLVPQTTCCLYLRGDGQKTLRSDTYIPSVGELTQLISQLCKELGIDGYWDDDWPSAMLKKDGVEMLLRLHLVDVEARVIIGGVLTGVRSVCLPSQKPAYCHPKALIIEAQREKGCSLSFHHAWCKLFNAMTSLIAGSRSESSPDILTRYLFIGRHSIGKESIIDSLEKDQHRDKENHDIHLNIPGLDMSDSRDAAAQEICEKLRGSDDFGTDCRSKLVFVVTLGKDGHVNPADGALMELVLNALPSGEEAISYGIIINNVTKEMRDNLNEDLSAWDTVRACLNEGHRKPTAYIHLRNHVNSVDEKENSQCNLFSLRRFLDILPSNCVKPHEVGDIESAGYESLIQKTEKAFLELRNDATKRRKKLQTDMTKLRKQMAEMSEQQDKQFRKLQKRKFNAAFSAGLDSCSGGPKLASAGSITPILPGVGKADIRTEPSSVPWELPMAKTRLLPPHYPLVPQTICCLYLRGDGQITFPSDVSLPTVEELTQTISQVCNKLGIDGYWDNNFPLAKLKQKDGVEMLLRMHLVDVEGRVIIGGVLTGVSSVCLPSEKPTEYHPKALMIEAQRDRGCSLSFHHTWRKLFNAMTSLKAGSRRGILDADASGVHSSPAPGLVSLVPSSTSSYSRASSFSSSSSWINSHSGDPYDSQFSEAEASSTVGAASRNPQDAIRAALDAPPLPQPAGAQYIIAMNKYNERWYFAGRLDKQSRRAVEKYFGHHGWYISENRPCGEGMVCYMLTSDIIEGGYALLSGR